MAQYRQHNVLIHILQEFFGQLMDLSFLCLNDLFLSDISFIFFLFIVPELALSALKLIEKLSTLIELNFADQVDNSSAVNLSIKCFEQLGF